MRETLEAVLREHTCLYASFAASEHADFARGSKQAMLNPAVVRHDPQAGRQGGAVVFSARDHGWAEDEFRFQAKDNFPYAAQGFEGTISLWLRGDPDAELHPDYPVDPFHISRHAADASFYLDLTRPNDWRYGSPRKLRFGFYNDSPARSMFEGGHLLVVGELGWSDGRWHHIVATWRNANSGQSDGYAEVFIDGVRRSWMEGYSHQITWDMSNMTIGLGQRYVGAIDELLILDRSLDAEAVAELYGQPGTLSVGR